MEYRDYYQALGVARDATQAEIKKAYRKLARKYHPDVSSEPDAEHQFKQLGEAYEVLKNPEKRAAYDQLGANWQAGQDFSPPPGWDAGFEYSGGFQGEGAGRFSDFFETIFGRAGAASADHGGGFEARGQDHHARIIIDLEDALHGATRAITLHAPQLDTSGHVQTRERTLNVRIPAGIRVGQHIRLAGQGAPGLGGAQAGDLFLEVEFKPHRLYHMEGADLFLDLPLAPWEAALGAVVKVPTPDGPVSLSVPADTAAGRKLRLRGRGMPGEPKGDLYVVAQIILPPATTDAARTCYESMAQALPFNPRASLGVE